jgi:EmrB/QacA subfamily drug resistance transporter
MVLAPVCITQFMVPLMLTAVGVALPSLGRDLGASAVQLGLIEQLYVLSVAMFVLTFGRLGDLVGQRKVFLPGLLVFTGMTSSLAFTHSIGMIMVQRFFQGFGAAMTQSCSLALVAAAYPKELRGRKIGIVSVFTYAGLSSGPVIGGYLTSHAGWRSIFWLAVPFGVAAIAMAVVGIPEARRNSADENMDWGGSLAYGISVGLIMLGAAHAKELPSGPIMIAAGLAGLGLFLAVERRTPAPLLDLRLLTNNRFFTLSCLATFGNYAATFGTTFLMSLYLQYLKGFPPRHAGLILLSQPLLQVIASPVAGGLADRMEPAKVASTGMLTSSAGLLLAAATIGPATPLWLIVGELVLIGAGFGLFITPNSTAIMSSVSSRQFGIASGMIGTMRNLGMAASMTVATLIFSILMGGNAITPATLPTFLTSVRAGLAVFAIFSCLGVMFSLRRGRRGAEQKPVGG